MDVGYKNSANQTSDGMDNVHFYKFCLSVYFIDEPKGGLVH